MNTIRSSACLGALCAATLIVLIRFFSAIDPVHESLRLWGHMTYRIPYDRLAIDWLGGIYMYPIIICLGKVEGFHNFVLCMCFAVVCFISILLLGIFGVVHHAYCFTVLTALAMSIHEFAHGRNWYRLHIKTWCFACMMGLLVCLRTGIAMATILTLICIVVSYASTSFIYFAHYAPRILVACFERVFPWGKKPTSL